MATVSGAGEGRGGMSTLILAARIEGPAALGRLLGAVHGYLTLLTVGRVGHDYSAKFGVSDIVQETAKDVHRGFEGFKGQTTGEFLMWLKRIVDNNVRDEVRRHGRAVAREVSIDDVAPIAVPAECEDIAIRGDRGTMIEDRLKRLPEPHATVLRLRYWEDLTFPEIGDRMGRSGEAVRKLWERALDRFRAENPDIEVPDR